MASEYGDVAVRLVVHGPDTLVDHSSSPVPVQLKLILPPLTTGARKVGGITNAAATVTALVNAAKLAGAPHGVPVCLDW